MNTETATTVLLVTLFAVAALSSLPLASKLAGGTPKAPHRELAFLALLLSFGGVVGVGILPAGTPLEFAGAMLTALALQGVFVLLMAGIFSLILERKASAL